MMTERTAVNMMQEPVAHPCRKSTWHPVGTALQALHARAIYSHQRPVCVLFLGKLSGWSRVMGSPEIIWETDALMYCRPIPCTMMDSMFRTPGHARTLSCFQVFLSWSSRGCVSWASFSKRGCCNSSLRFLRQRRIALNLW